MADNPAAHDAPPRGLRAEQLAQGNGLFLEGEWAGGSKSTNGLSFYGTVDVGGADISVSGRGPIGDAMARIPIGSWVRFSVAMRESATGAFLAARRLEAQAESL